MMLWASPAVGVGLACLKAARSLFPSCRSELRSWGHSFGHLECNLSR